MVDTILTPSDATPCNTPQEQADILFFQIDNYLSELTTEAEQGIARQNLGVYGKDEVYTQMQTDNKISQEVGKAVNNHLAADDPHSILPKVQTMIKGFVKDDGTVPFTAPQKGKAPLLDDHLTTKGFVENLLNEHLKRTDPHNVMSLVQQELKSYAKKDEIAYKKETFTKDEIIKKLEKFVKNDGTTPFVAPQSGVTPISDHHVATKGYADTILFKHIVEADPHGFLTILNQRLSNYYKTTETYSKAETYSRAQIDQVINTLVCAAAAEAIKEHTRQFDPHQILREIYNKHYVTRDGTVPFTAPQKGIDAIENDHLVTLAQLQNVQDILSNKFNKYQPVWQTSGAVQTTVGFVEDNTEVPSKMTFQEIMDAIFYGKTIDVVSKKVAAVGTIVPVTMVVRGKLHIEKAELYQNNKLVGTYGPENFVEWKHTVDSLSIKERTIFTLVVTYTNGTVLSDTWTTEVAYGVFVGAVDKSCKPQDLTYNCMLENTQMDPNNNVMYAKYHHHTFRITHKFSFAGSPKKIVLVLPKSYPQLDYMYTPSQHFGLDAFDIQNIPVILPGFDEAIIYTVYMYKESLYEFHSEVTFKLKEYEQ